jgi:putative spermidine/putrescine transport system ATP-binding protein
MDGKATIETANIKPGGVRIAGLRKSYGPHVALTDASIDIAPGELVSLLGPSGCGKTTLLRCIAGLIQPDSGDIVVDGQSLVSLPAYKRNLGMVFQSYALFPHLTVQKNVEFGLKDRGSTTGDRRVREALELVRMASYAAHYPRQLSGGQQQRVALARALATSPRLLLLDEPLAALDAKLRESVQVELRQLQRQLGITTIFVTHDQREAMTISDRVAMMHNGRIEQCAAPEELYRRPLSAAVAAFVGQVNQISGIIVGDASGGIRLSVDGKPGELAAPRSNNIPTGAAALAMLRPEHMTFTLGQASAPLGEGRQRVNVSVLDDVFIGERRLLYVESEIGQLVVGGRTGDPLLKYDAGTVGSVSWNVTDLMVFPASNPPS